MVKFSRKKKCTVYRCTLVMQLLQDQTSAAQMAQHMKCARKGKRKGRERERGIGGKIRDQITKKKKKKKNAHTFSHRDPCAMTFCECKKLTVLDCEQ